MPYDGFFASEGGTAWPNWGGTEWASLDTPVLSAKNHIIHGPVFGEHITDAVAVVLMSIVRAWAARFAEFSGAKGCACTRRPS